MNLRIIYTISGNRWIQKLIDNHGDQGAIHFLLQGISFLRISQKINPLLFEPAPSTVFVCNHHTGAIDFLSTFPFLAKHVPNLKVIANKKILHLYPLKEIILPVHGMSEQKNNSSNLLSIIRHLKNGGSVLIFPAGKVAGKVNGVVKDSEWHEGCATLIREYSKFVIPVYVDAQNSRLFYILRKLFPRLSMLFLLRSLRGSKGKKINVCVGRPIESNTFSHCDNKTILAQLREQVYQLKNNVNYV